MPKIKLIIVRHGQTNGNKERRLQLPTIPLSEDGNEQAKLLGKHLGKIYGKKIKRILSSDLQRTVDTAKHLKKEIEDVINEEINLTFHDLLQERHFGDLRGLKFEDAANLAGVDLFDINFKPKNGESWSESHKRVTNAYDFVKQEVRDHHEKHKDTFDDKEEEHVYLVVSHGLWKSSLARYHLVPDKTDKDGNKQTRFMFANTSFTIAEFDSEKLSSIPKILSLGAIDHLEDFEHLKPNQEHMEKVAASLRKKAKL